jgi:hypothetical protein
MHWFPEGGQFSMIGPVPMLLPHVALASAIDAVTVFVA